MSNPYFAFKQFTIYQQNAAMKVGTDGVLLGAWVQVEDAETLLDVGTGSGLIALMCAQRSNARITAVEIDRNSFMQACDNINNCSWKNRIEIYHQSFQQFAKKCSTLFDVIVCNPPYFKNSLKSPVPARNIARHTEMLSYECLLQHSSKLLKVNGKLAVIIPADEYLHFTDIAYLSGLYVTKALFVRSTEAKPFSRCLAEFSKNKTITPQTANLTIKNKNSNDYTENFKELTREYYLAF